jgi:hypothetical protein
VTPNIKALAEWIITQCGVEGLRNSGGKWQHINDEDKKQARLEHMLDRYLSDTCQKLETR